MIFVDGISSKVICSGLTFTVFGGFFDASCKVKFGDKVAVVESWAESFITVVVPDIGGTFTVYVVDGANHSLNAGSVKIGNTLSVPVYNFVRDYSVDDFKDVAESMFPKGQLFDFSTGSNFKKLVAGFGTALRYCWGVIRSVVQALDPLHTDSFDEWERELGLPEVGIQAFSDEERRREIYRAGFAHGGCSINFYKRILSLLKVDADIFEYVYNPEKFTGIDFGDDDPRFYMMIRFRVPLLTYDYFRAGESVAGDLLLDFSNYNVESVFEKIKHAHIKIIYSYMTPRNMVVITSSGAAIVTSNGERLIAYAYPE